MLGEIQPFLLGQRGLEVARPADQPGLALLADAALEHRLDEDLAVAVDERLDLVLATRPGPSTSRRGKSDDAGAVARRAAFP